MNRAPFFFKVTISNLGDIIVDGRVVSSDEDLVFELRQVRQERLEHLVDLRSKLAGRAQYQSSDIVLLQRQFLQKQIKAKLFH